jgi:hypothetical protein
MSCVTHKSIATKKILANFLQRPCHSKWGMHMPNEQISNVYLWSKCEACFVYHAEIFQVLALHVVLLVSSESSGWVRVHQLGLRLFGAMGWKLLIIEPFSGWKLNKIEIENFIHVKPFSWPTHVAFWVRLVGCYSMGQCHSIGQVYGALAWKGGGEAVHWARIRLWSGRWAVTISPIPVNRHIFQAKKIGFLIFLSAPISS